MTVPSLPPCPTPCDDDCGTPCHEEHQIPGKRGHQPWGCEDIRKAIAKAAERERLGVLSPGERDAVMRDLGELLEALGLGSHARPQSPHEVMLEAIAEVARLRGTEGKWWAGPGDHPVRAPCDCECSVAATIAERERCAQLAEREALMADAGLNGAQAAALRRLAHLLRQEPS